MKEEAAEATWRSIRSHLEARQTWIVGAIRDYPAPITACDAQFDHLLEQRGGISRELKRLERACQEGDATENGTENVSENGTADVTGNAIAAFIASSPFLDGEPALAPREPEAHPEPAAPKRIAKRIAP